MTEAQIRGVSPATFAYLCKTFPYICGATFAIHGVHSLKQGKRLDEAPSTIERLRRASALSVSTLSAGSRRCLNREWLGPFADHDKRRPGRGMRGPWALVVAHEGQHGATEGLGAANRAGVAQLGEGARHQHGRGIGIHRPVGHQEGAGASVEERAREARQGLRTGLFTARGIARREDHPVGVELQTGDQPIAIEARDGALHTRLGPADNADATLAGPPNPIMGLLLGLLDVAGAEARGVTFQGDPAILGRIGANITPAAAPS